MSCTSRRVFLLQIAATGTAAMAAAGAARAQGAAKVDEKDPQAVALGYVADTNKADEKKFTNHKKDQKCAGCALYGGKPTDPMAPCAIFAGKQVMAGGWCSAYSKKA